jgi:hypothetical protein
MMTGPMRSSPVEETSTSTLRSITPFVIASSDKSVPIMSYNASRVIMPFESFKSARATIAASGWVFSIKEKTSRSFDIFDITDIF